VREASNPEDVVRSRFQSVLAATDLSVRDQAGPRPSTPALPGWPTGDEGPLAWSDLIPSWPDDFDRDISEAAPPPVSSPPVSSPPVSSRLVPAPASALTGAAAEARVFPRSAAVEDPSGFDAEMNPGPGAEVYRPGPRPQPAAGVYPDPVYEWHEEGGDARQGYPASGPGDDDADLLGGHLRRGYPEFDADASDAARRVRLGAFDPGRRGVRALAVVAVIVVLIAAVLAWRARPRVDPVPPVPAAVDATATADGAAAGDAPVGKSTVAGGVVVAIGGKVKKPGLVRLPAGSRVADALQAAGGADPGVDVALLNLARKVVDGELILVGVTPPPGAVVATGPAGAPAAAAGPVNLNTATLADLDTLPGVGPVLAQRILDAREAQGGFKSVSDLRKVDGIGDSRYEQLKDLVTV
jgi:competence protein ComEA